MTRQKIIDSATDAIAANFNPFGLNVADSSSEDVELEMLKIAVMNPGLYNTLKSIFAQHKYPEKLDGTGRAVHKFFSNREG